MYRLASTTALIAVLGWAVPVRAADVTLAWDANAEPDLAGYKIYYGLSPEPPYDGTFADQGPSPVDFPLDKLGDPSSPEVTLTGVPDCAHVYFAATAYDNEGLESSFSISVDATIAGKPRIEVEPGQREGEIHVRWVPPVAGGALSNFRVHYGPSAEGPYTGTEADQGASPIAVDAATTELTLTGFAAGTMVHVMVEEVCGDGTQKESDPASMQAPAPTQAPDQTMPDEMSDRLGDVSGGCTAVPPGSGSLWLLLVGALALRVRRRG